VRLAFLAGLLGACSFTPTHEDDPDLTSPDAAVTTASEIEWLGDLELRRDGYTLPVDQVLPGPLDVCAQTYPINAAARATLHWTSATGEPREAPMTIESPAAGPFGNNTRWCARLDAEPRELALHVLAEDAAGAPVRADLAVTPRTEIALFETAPDAASWRMAGPGSFALDGDTLRAQPAGGLGLYWCAIPTPADFELSLEARLDRFDDNSGVFVRFRDPDGFGYDNTAWVAVHDGLEIQIDETARPDGADVHRTGAVYEQPSSFVRAPDGTPGAWRRFDITVRGSRIIVRIDGAQVTDLTFAGDPTRPDRALPSTSGAPRFIGLQSHTGAVAFRHVKLRAL
jgi:hypothetical protein